MEGLLPLPSKMGRPRKTDLRTVFNAIQYLLGTSCQWHALPSAFPPFTTVWNYFYAWRDSGVLANLLAALRKLAPALSGVRCNGRCRILADAIDFFHMDALSAVVPPKVNVDIQLTLMASALYRLLANRAGREMKAAKVQTIFRKPVYASATVEITADEIVVSFGRRANNPLLIAAGYGDIRQKIPWLGDRTLRFRFF